MSTTLISPRVERVIEALGHQLFAKSSGPLVDPIVVPPWLIHRRTAAADFIRATDLVREYARQGWVLDKAHNDYMNRLLREIR